MVALQREGLPEFEVLNGVNVYRIQTRTVNEKGLLTYASRILRFPATRDIGVEKATSEVTL